MLVKPNTTTASVHDMSIEAAARGRDEVIKLSDGRTLGYAQFGFSAGPTVICLHGLPGSRLEASLWSSCASARHMRLIAPDRPGMGLSSRKADRTVMEYPSDIAQLVKHLGLDEFAMMGVSGGGMYALACAVQKEKLPGLCGVGIVAGLGPRDLSQQGMGLVQKLSFYAMDWVPKGVVRWLWDYMVGKAARNPDRSVLATALKKSTAALQGPDGEICKDENVLSGLTESLREAFTQGSEGYVDEATLTTKPWGFDLATIKDIHVKLWYGNKDELAPPAVGRAIAQCISGATCKCYEAEAHISTAVRHQDEILASLYREIVKKDDVL